MPPSSSRPTTDASVERERFAVTPSGDPVDAITLTNAHGVSVRFVTYGGIILSVDVPDRYGTFGDVTLGYATFDEYLSDEFYFGALVGRYANRIAGGRFTLDGVTYDVGRNDGRNHLHGGPHGFHQQLWSAEPFVRDGAVGAVLGYTSPAGEGGYPGTLDVRVTYTLTDRGAFIVDYHATTDAATPVCLTQHAYFNLAGHDRGDTLGHELTLPASRITPVGADLIPTGELRTVHGTPFDFTESCPIGERIDADDAQLRLTGGYDHNFVLDEPSRNDAPAFAARLLDPVSGRTLEVWTTEPAIQLFSGNELHAGLVGKHGRPYRRYSGIALETQHYPDSPNHPRFPSTIVRPDQPYTSRTVFQFGVR